MITLGAVSGSRDNNFNLIRMIAASSVLVSHAFPVTIGIGTEEPLDQVIGHSLGWVAVGIFFVISGFLIARSFDRKARLADWTAARIMRLFPGLFVVLVLTMLVLGPLTTTLPLSVYFFSPETWSYVPRNLSLMFLQYALPGVFVDAPYPATINGSLWTLVHEVICYVGVLIVGLAGLLRRPILASVGFAVYLAAYAGLVFIDPDHLPSRLLALRDLSFPFAIGTLLYVWRDRIPLSYWGALGLGIIAALAYITPIFTEAFLVWLAYTIFVLAYRPGGIIRNYNRIGDYSYGMYIYAFPVQQLCVWQGIDTPLTNMAVAFPVTLVLAIASWHLVEKPWLARRGQLADFMSRSGRMANRPALKHRQGEKPVSRR